MFSATLFYATLLLALVHSAFADFTINSPNLVQCETAQITWTEAVSPYNLIVVSAQNVCGAPLLDLGNFTALATNFTVNLAAGTQVVLSLEDAARDEAWSNSITVGSSNDTSCLASAASHTPTPSAAAGVANAGANPTSGALVVHPLNALSMLGIVASVFVFAL